MLWVALTGSFLVPIYYKARAKGHNALAFTLLAAFLLALCAAGFLGTGRTWFLVPMFAVPLAILGVLFAVQPRPAPPGERISFTCPNCHRVVELLRQHMGLTDLCPQCGETLTVPTASGSAEGAVPQRARPQAASGPVPYATFPNENDAECLASVLRENGIEATIVHGDSEVVVPSIVARKSRVVIEAADWDRAVAIERGWLATATRR